ncbi:multidrug efflux system outer membrane protein [Sphingomonas jejuensis]|uniref:Multidrug efflux system outer membrane protein n=1 Tax=Sphingomonas jejuensis TaxID=904715 RepID=A0ABX0XPC4_9SPHN|nr:efflux transporter outer membrane subunit [Sphingomonas jejuensis]NJC35246.1 multidrug efflux system outer membrane protein [Sphingomonas jejuensis]
MRRAAFSLPLAALIGGCSLAPAYRQPALPVPASWPAGDAYLRQTEATLPALSYRDLFRDPRLVALIEQAFANNRDLRVAAANIAATRAQYRIQRADLFPQVDVSGRYSYSGGGNGATAVAGTGAGGTPSPTPTPGTGTPTPTPGTPVPGTGGTSTVTTLSRSASSYSIDLGITAFELDLFGRIRSQTEAALDRFFATEAAARSVRLTLVGDIADAWLIYAADRSLLRIAEQTAASAERSVSLTRARLRGGVAPRSDLRQAEQVLFTAQSDLAEQRTALAQDVNALRLLVGAEIDPALLPQSIEQVEASIAALPAGLDSSILLRRPDVVQAEYELRAANAEIGAARAELFPRISLTGIVGFASDALRTLFTGDAFNYSVAPNVSYSIFRAGAGRAGVALTQAQRDAALSSYERSIQVAFREVADALARRGTIADQLRADRNFEAAAADTFELANARYRGGVDTFLSNLDAQRSLYAAQRNLVLTRLTAGSNLVTLYRTLGGDPLVAADGASTAAPTPGTNGPADGADSPAR